MEKKDQTVIKIPKIKKNGLHNKIKTIFFNSIYPDPPVLSKLTLVN